MSKKIKVENIYEIFGQQPKKALQMFNDGLDKQTIHQRTGLTAGVQDASFSINAGEIFVVMGLSGSGKSTMVRMLNRLIAPTAGHIYVDGQDVATMADTELLALRRQKMSMVFQSFALMPHLSVLENAAFGLEMAGVDKKSRQERAMQALEQVGLEGYHHSRPKQLSGGMQQRVGLARGLPLASEQFDLVVFHTTLSHVPEPQGVLAEAHRVLRPGGPLAVFDGDYATATVAGGPGDPLETCVEAFRGGYVHDPWLVRRLTGLLAGSGFAVEAMCSHGYVETGEGGYMLSWIERGAELLQQQGRIGAAQVEAFKNEARRRSDSGSWFGHIAFASILGRKPR